jgi:hypothetical protein
VSLALLVWAICGTAIAGYYFTQYSTYRNEYHNLLGELTTLSVAMSNVSDVMNSISLRVNMLVSYGNGTNMWFNDTTLPVGTTAFTALQLMISNVNYTNYGGTLGILVTSISGLTNNSTNGWFYWVRPANVSTWTLPLYSCAQYILHKNDTIAFTYQSYNPWPTSPFMT